jgi:hypothetical protein
VTDWDDVYDPGAASVALASPLDNETSSAAFDMSPPESGFFPSLPFGGKNPVRA